MPKIENLKRLQTKLKALERKGKQATVSVTVGFTQRYAVFVHERTDIKHAEGKQAKYLETPARKLSGELGTITETIFKTTGSMLKGLLVAGLRLQREAQKIVPIDTSALKASAFTTPTKNIEAASKKAFANSEKTRNRELRKRNKNK